MVIPDDQNSDFVVNATEQKVKREPPQIRSPAKENRCPEIRLGAADKPIAKRQVVINSARTALIAGTAGSKFQPGRCAGSKENKMGDGLSK